MHIEFYKENPSDKVWRARRVSDSGDFVMGEALFSFDGETIFSLFSDYPHRLSESQKEIFDREYPYWAETLSAR